MQRRRKNLLRLLLRTAAFMIVIFSLLVSACDSPSNEQAANSIPPEQLPWRFSIRTIDPISAALEYRIADLNGDGFSDLVHILGDMNAAGKTPAHVTISDLLEGHVSEQLNFRGSIDAACFDWDHDGDQEIFVEEQLDDDVFLHVYDHRGNFLQSIPVVIDAPEAANPIWRCHAVPAGLIDGNRDGHPDLLIFINTNEAYQPRGLKLLDLQTMQWIWHYPCGAAIGRIQISDANRDGEAEIYSTTNAPSNGAGCLINGTDDGHSWFLILSASGHVLHRESVGGPFSFFSAIPHDMDRNGRDEVILLRRSRNSLVPEKTMIAFWEPEQQQTLYQKEYERFPLDRINFIDVDNNGLDELLIFWQDGTIEARNQRNDVVKKIALGEQLYGEPIVVDVDADGEPELFVASRSRIFAFSRQLALRATYALEFPRLDYADMGKGKPKLIVARQREVRYMLELNTNYTAPLTIGLPLIVAFFCGGILVLLLATLRQKRSSQAPETWVPKLYSIHSDSGLLAVDLNEQVQFINKKLIPMIGLEQSPQLPCTLGNLFTKENYRALSALMNDSKQLAAPARPRHIVLQEIGAGPDIKITARPYRNARGRLLGQLLIFDDISEQSLSNRAKAWATLAQRLAHQIKTPLSSVLLAVQRLQMEYQRDGLAKANIYDRYVEYVAEEVTRIRRITDGFLKIARLEAPAFAPVNLNQVIIAILDKYRPVIAQGVTLETDLAPDLPVVALDEQQIKMALDVLIENSLDAMDEGGRLTITTRLQQVLAARGDNKIKEFILIECADTGRGIPAESMQKLFDPFYTTKSGGTGLGLPIAKKIIEDHQGSIDLSSKPGIGTVVSLRLPLEVVETN